MDRDEIEVVHEPAAESSKSSVTIIKDVTHLVNHMEMMHDKRIVKNLQAAGLSNVGFDEGDEVLYSKIEHDAVMANGEPLLLAVIRHVKDLDQQFRYVAILLCEHADVNIIDTEGKTALMYSCMFGYEKLAKCLLSNGKTNLYQTDYDGNTAFMHAAANGRLNILKIYLKILRKIEKQHQLKPSSKVQSHHQRKDSHTSLCFETFLEMENREGLNASMVAVKNKHLDCVRLIEEARLKYFKETGTNRNLFHTTDASGKKRLPTANAKYKFQAGGSCESLSTRVLNVEDDSNLEISEGKTNVSKRLLNFRRDSKFQSQQDLQRRRNSEVDVPFRLIIGKTDSDIKQIQQQPQTSHEILKHEEPQNISSTTSAAPKKTLMQGVMSIFRRRPRHNPMFHRSQMNHSVSTDVQPYNKSGQNRRKSIDVGLQAFHQLVEKPILTECTILDETLQE